MPDTALDRKAYRQYALNRKGVQQKQIAALAGVSEATVSRVIAGSLRNATVEVLIAGLTGEPLTELFPNGTEATQAA